MALIKPLRILSGKEQEAALSDTLLINNIQGDTISGGNLNLFSTNNATKGFINFGSSGSAFDETNNMLLVKKASLGATVVIANEGFYAQNLTAATTGPVNQNSPALIFEGQVWATLSAVSQSNKVYVGMTGLSGTTSTGGALTIGHSTNGGAFVAGYSFQTASSNQFTFNSIGLTINAISGGGISLTGTSAANNKFLTMKNFIYQTQATTTTGDFGMQFLNPSSTVTSGTVDGVQVVGTFAPTSGTGVFNLIHIIPTINQTGGANGITRGIYIQPTLTASSDFRALEISAGISILAASTTSKASLNIPSGTAPTTPNNGDIWFDGTNIKMQIGGVTKTFTLT